MEDTDVLETETPVAAPKGKRGRKPAPRTPAQQEATRKALAALAERRKALALAGGDDPAVKAKQAEEKLKRQAAARAIIEGENKTVAAELAEIKAIVAQTHLDTMEAAAKATAMRKHKKKVVVVPEPDSDTSSSEEEVVVVRKKAKTKVAVPLAPVREAAPAPAPAPAPAAPEFPAKPVRQGRPQLDRTLFTR